MLFAVSFVDSRRLCRTYAIAVLVSIILVMVLSLIGFIPIWDRIPNGILVFSYGFTHPNVLGGYLLSAMGALTYVYWDGRHWLVPLVLTSIAAAFAKMTLSSNSSAVLFALMSFVNIAGHVGAVRRISASLLRHQVSLLILVPILFGGTMLLLTANHVGCGAFADMVDRLTHFRPYYANQYYVAHGGFTLFGRPYVNSSTYHNGLSFAAVDCSYSYMSLVNGIAALLVCFVTYTSLVIRSRREGVHPFAVAAILIYAVYGVVEGYPMYLRSNFTLLLLAGLDKTALSCLSDSCCSPIKVNG